MSEEEILKKAIEKAVKNGFEHYLEGEKIEWSEANLKGLCTNQIGINTVIFLHSFAKAFWEEEWVSDGFGGFDRKGRNYEGTKLFAWQYHLQQMVLEENPIDYLEKFL